VTSNSSLDWFKYKHDYNKHYKSAAEENERKQIFLENANRIRNFQRNNPNATFTVAINHLTDRRIEVNRIYTQDKSMNKINSFRNLFLVQNIMLISFVKMQNVHSRKRIFQIHSIGVQKV
jgi:hypothetical protein